MNFTFLKCKKMNQIYASIPGDRTEHQVRVSIPNTNCFIIIDKNGFYGCYSINIVYKNIDIGGIDFIFSEDGNWSGAVSLFNFNVYKASGDETWSTGTLFLTYLIGLAKSYGINTLYVIDNSSIICGDSKTPLKLLKQLARKDTFYESFGFKPTSPKSAERVKKILHSLGDINLKNLFNFRQEGTLYELALNCLNTHTDHENLNTILDSIFKDGMVETKYRLLVEEYKTLYDRHYRLDL